MVLVPWENKRNFWSPLSHVLSFYLGPCHSCSVVDCPKQSLPHPPSYPTHIPKHNNNKSKIKRNNIMKKLNSFINFDYMKHGCKFFVIKIEIWSKTGGSSI